MPMSDITHILAKIESGDPAAAEQLLPLVYDELRRWLPPSWRTRNPGRRSRRQRWCMKPTCDWSIGPCRSSGTINGISSRRRPRRCGGS